MRVIITPEDFKNAPIGFDGNECPLAQALKRAGVKNFFMGFKKIYSEPSDGYAPSSILFEIPTEEWGGKGGKYPIETINQISKQAKKSLKGIPTVELELTEV